MSQRLALAFVLSAFLLAPPASAQDRKEPADALHLVMNYPYQIWATGTTRIHVCLYTPDFRPAKGAKVTVNDKEVGTADEHGVCIFDYTPANSEQHRLVAEWKEGDRTHRVQKSFACNSRTESYRSEQVYVYTDRGVYNPGQSIRVRTIAWELTGGYAPLKDAKLQFLLQDGKQRVYTGGWITTNEFGVGAIDLPLSENMPEGNYQLVVLRDKTREVALLRVKRFVAPILSIQHDLKRFLTPAQADLPITAKVGYFSGGTLVSSTLRIEVLDRPDGTVVFTKDVPATAPGAHAVTLTGEDLGSFRGKLAPEQPFQMRLTATDSFGRTDSVTRDMVFTQRPYRAVLELDKDDYPQGEAVQLLVKVVDLDGKPAAAIPLLLSVPQFQVKQEGNTDAQGVATFTFPMGGGPGTAVVTSAGMTAPLGERAVPFNQPKPMVSKVSAPPGQQGSRALVKVSFDPKYVPIEKVIHADLTDISGALVASMEIPIRDEDGTYVAEGPLVSPTWGTMLVNLYCCAVEKANEDKPRTSETVGFVTEGQHVTFYPDQQVEITIEGLKPRVRPGEKLDITITARTKEGEEACLGAALVDQAVISLLDPLEKTPMDRFYNPQLKVISTGGSAVLTWPVVDRTWGNPWRDIAYSDWGWKAPGPRVDDGVAQGGGADLGAEKALGQQAGGAKGHSLKKLPGAPEAGDNASSSDSDSYDAEEAREDAAPSPERTITIRTRFPETALWEPILATRGGKCSLTLEIPDAITVQRLSVVASDKKGGVGLKTEAIEVRQELFVLSGLPATIAIGDEVVVGALVRNASGQGVACKVRLESDALAILSEPESEASIEDGASAVVTWKVRAYYCGTAKYRVVAGNGQFEDSEERTLFVSPVGEPEAQVTRGTVTKEAAWAATANVPEGAAYATAFLNVSFPNRVPAIQGVEAMARYPHGCAEQITSAAMTNLVILEYGIESGKVDASRMQALRDSLRTAIARLLATQREDGGWDWFLGRGPSKRPNLYLTAYVLRFLTDVRAVDLYVPDAALAQAAGFVMKHRGPEGLWSGKDAFFWEKTNEAVDMALSAELFAVLARVPTDALKEHAQGLQDVKGKVEAYLLTSPEEPLAVANAIDGLLAWSRSRKDEALRASLDASIEHLIALKRQGYWEPHWYHAYGGMVELNARILDLLRETDAGRYDAYLREGVAWLLSTQEAWGAWHNTIGTATAVRALLRAATGEEEVACAVEVRVNGATVAKVQIDPADPFLSAASLRSLELTPHLKAGDNAIEVVYGGNLKAPVVLETRTWSRDLKEAAGTLRVKRTAPETARGGEPVEVTIEVTTNVPAPFLLIEERIPANMEVDTRSLDALKTEGRIADWKLADALYLYLEGVEGTVSIPYRLTGLREGEAAHPGTRVSGMYDATLSGATVGGRIRVER